MSQVVYIPLNRILLREGSEIRLLRALKYLSSNPVPQSNTLIQTMPSERFSWSLASIVPLLFLCAALSRLLSKNAVSSLLHILYSCTLSSLLIIAIFYIALMMISYTMGQYYLQSSTAFAKYSSMLEGDERNRNKNQHNSTLNVASSKNDKNKETILSEISEVSIDTNPPADGRRVIFLTGTTGFVGSMLLRDVLFHREIMHVERVLVLCRPRFGISGKNRIMKLLQGEMFSFLSNEQKDELIEVLEGDTTKENAGLCDADVERLRKDYSISHVINCAASVSFTKFTRCRCCQYF
jgi:hypothetical protein